MAVVKPRGYYPCDTCLGGEALELHLLSRKFEFYDSK